MPHVIAKLTRGTEKTGGNNFSTAHFEYNALSAETTNNCFSFLCDANEAKIFLAGVIDLLGNPKGPVEQGNPKYLC